MRILLAIDGSPCSQVAVEEICLRPWPVGSEVRVITVDGPLPEPYRDGTTTMFDEIHKQILKSAMKSLNAAVATLRRKAPSLTVTHVLREGRAKDAILDEAEQWDADLVVLGSHGYGAVKRLFLGSVSLAVATNAPCSVEIVRAKAVSKRPEAEPRPSRQAPPRR